jgi:hypothetical protein
MNVEIPSFILELSNQLNNQPSRSTSHPFYQVRCNRAYVTQEGYDCAYFVVQDEDGIVYQSNKNDHESFAQYLNENYSEWLSDTFEDVEVIDVDFVLDNFDFDCEDLPKGLTKLWMQEIEEVVSTHLTLDAAESFIKRKQHDYPKLFTYAESAYWSPQLRELQDWLKSLTKPSESITQQGGTK